MKHTRTWISQSLLALFCALAALPACKTKEKLPALRDQLAGPVDLVTSPSGKYFYVLNSDYERRFNNGSILIVDPDAADGSRKVGNFKTRRMGRSLYVAQNRLLVTYADDSNQNYGFMEIYDLTEETAPRLVMSRDFECLPINGVIAPSQPYYAITCAGGDVWIGKGLEDGATAQSLDKVRSYGYDRHALYFYEGAKTWLLAFPTDFDALDTGDSVYQDSLTYDLASDAMKDGSNGVPDVHENTPQVRRRQQFQWPYQLVAYNLTDEEAASVDHAAQTPETPAYGNFRYIPLGTFQKPTQADKEQRYITYTLASENGIPNGTEGTLDPTQHSYHTNYWEIKPSLSGDTQEFYISQRGDYGAQANSVLKMRLNDESLLAAPATTTFDQIFTVERVYGSEVDRDNSGRYPGDFEPALIDGEPMLLINSFRDLIYFATAPFYSITRKYLDGPKAEFEEPSSRDSVQYESSYYQLAVSGSGKVLTASFYGNVLYLFDANPSISIKDQTPIRIE